MNIKIMLVSLVAVFSLFGLKVVADTNTTNTIVCAYTNNVSTNNVTTNSVNVVTNSVKR